MADFTQRHSDIHSTLPMLRLLSYKDAKIFDTCDHALSDKKLPVNFTALPTLWQKQIKHLNLHFKEMFIGARPTILLQIFWELEQGIICLFLS